MPKVAVFDCDGVVVLNNPRFSQFLAQKQHLSESTVLEFFEGPMIDCILGKQDLKQALDPYLSKWRWTGTVESLLDYWFTNESTLNQDLIQVIKTAKAQGISCYLATNQEKYRTQYLADNLGLLNIFDHMFVSSEIGAKKPQWKFYHYLIDSIEYLDAITSPNQIFFWDNSQANVDAAKVQGLNAFLYVSPQEVAQELGI